MKIKRKNLEKMLIQASQWEDMITQEESTMNIPYFTLKRMVIDRIIEEFKESK